MQSAGTRATLVVREQTKPMAGDHANVTSKVRYLPGGLKKFRVFISCICNVREFVRVQRVDPHFPKVGRLERDDRECLSQGSVQ